ncbi:hypothetical protein EV360DRAFT_84964 [Lentinula raphanica]|nr:hypothetical protein EV360DRAFT_84964 [Lentinula raphanica]
MARHEISIPISSLLNPMPSNSGSLVPQGHSYTPACNHLQSLSDRNSVNVGVDRTVIHSDYKLSRKSLLSVVYLYGSDTSLEYPETGDNGVGHLFRMKPEDWESPGADFAYSRGDPRGISREYVTVPLLVDSRNGEMVPCVTRHSTCQGVKVCPYHEAEENEGHHYSATREQLMHRMRHSRAQQAKYTSPARDVFDKTSAYLIALKRLGCTAGAQEILDEQSLHSPEDRLAFRRGYPDRPDRCTGQLLFGVTFSGVPYIKCEFHSTMSRDHFFDNTVGNGSLHIEYLEAVLTNDQEEVDRIEMEAQQEGYGPKTDCQTVLNNSAQRHSCSWNHRSEDGELKQPKLVSLTCHCVFREYEPLKEFREFCPFILITSKGLHSHPIPLPEKTPRAAKAELDQLFQRLEVDLADMSPRKFIRHPIVQSYLTSRFPLLQNPMLSDVHISLSNRSHLKAYLDRAKKVHFPEGTGWTGLLHFKAQQDAMLQPAERYLRTMIEVAGAELNDDEDDLPSDQNHFSQPLRVAICMTSAASENFIAAQYLQSDIAFKRIVGFYEFEIAAVDSCFNTSMTLCRVYLNRQTANAHQIVLAEINKILVADTGRGLRWRHIHGNSMNDYDGVILNWVVDQHRGQAKGLGLYLQEVSRSLPKKQDFHEPNRSIQDLSPKCSVTDLVRNVMRSLICIQHSNWDGALHDIRASGGKAGRDWLADKESTKFAFPAMCWEKSFIPLEIWQARRRESNIVEIVHANVNLEGTGCTLVGGVYKGRHYDLLKQRSLQNRVNFGIRESYQSKHPYENAMKNVRRKMSAQQKNMHQVDAKIQSHNAKISELITRLKDANDRAQHFYQLVYPSSGSRSTFQASGQVLSSYEAAKKAADKAKSAFERQVNLGRALVGKGSGRVNILLPE